MYGYRWKKPDDAADFSVEKIPEKVSQLKYTIGGPNPPPGLSVTRVITTGEGADEETKLYFSKPLKSAGAEGTGEARNIIALEDGDIEEDFETVSVDGVIYTIEVTGQTVGFTRDSTATETLKTESAENQKFLAEVKATTLSVDGLPGKKSISGLTIRKDGNIEVPLIYQDVEGEDYIAILLGNKDKWKDGRDWSDVIIS